MPRTRITTAIAVALFASGCTAPVRMTADSAAADPAAEHDPALHAEHQNHARQSAAASDTTFAALQARGKVGMGVDQYTSTHTFESLRDGGRITLRRDTDDSTGAEQIRAHLRAIASAFAAGDFTTPGFVHADSVPGTDIMAARKATISYRVAAIPRGGVLDMSTSDSAALDAIHRFLAYQRREHRAGGGTSAPPPPTAGSPAPGVPDAPARDGDARAQ